MLASFLGIAPVQAQVPPDLVAANRAIGKATDQTATAKVYGPLAETAPYAGITVARDVSYGPYPRNMLDVFQPATPGRPRAVVIYFSGGAQTRGSGDKNLPAAGIFYDNIMVWAARHSLVGVNTDRRAWQGARWDAGAQDVGAAVRWVKAHVGRYGGDPDRIFLFGHGYGGTDVAAYLAHPDLWESPSPGVKGAILMSAPFNLAPLMGAPGNRANVPMFDPAHSSLEGLKALNLPIYMGSAEFDEDAVRASADLLRQQLCLKSCPAFDVYKDHQHISVTYSFNTADQSVSGPVLAWIGSVR
jgi:triacylglycerol lipase